MKPVRLALALLFASSSALASFAHPVPARRYQGARVAPRDYLVAARMCAGETGVHRAGWMESCAAQVGVTARRAARRGVTLGTMARAYSAALKPAHGRPWIMALDESGRPPRGFPARASWTDYRPRWRRLVWIVRSQLAGDVVDPCPRANHFGSLHLDGHNATAAGWSRVCPHVSARQGFWTSLETETETQR